MTLRSGTAAWIGRAFLAACFAAAGALAQDYGDTPYVPTPQNVVEKMLEIAKVGPADYVIDLGSGDGRMIITAARKHGAQGFGVDLDRRLVTLSNKRAAEAGVAKRAVFYQRDLYKTDVRRATVLTIYLLPEVNLMVRPKLLAELRPGTRIVSHDYDMGEWEPDLQMELAAPGKTVGVGERSKIFYWVVPANAAGRWQWELAVDGKPAQHELALNQQFQKLDGTLSAARRQMAIRDGALSGEQIGFAATAGTGRAAVRYEYSGRVAGNAIEGTVRVARGANSQEFAWRAARVETWPPRHLLPDASQPQLQLVR